MSYKNLRLEDILETKNLLNEEKTGINYQREDEAREVVMHYIRDNSGFPNNYLIKFYWFLKSDRFTKGVDRFLDTVLINNNKEEKKKKLDKISHGIEWFAQGYLGGEMNRENQNLVALTANKEPYKLTIRNSWIAIGMSPQYMLYSTLTTTIAKYIFPDIDDQNIGLGLTGLVTIGNLARMYVASKTKKSYAGFGMNSIFINTGSYLKKLTSKLSRKNKVKTYNNTLD